MTVSELHLDGIVCQKIIRFTSGRLRTSIEITMWGQAAGTEGAQRARKRHGKGKEAEEREGGRRNGQLAGRADKLLKDFPFAFLALCR